MCRFEPWDANKTEWTWNQTYKTLIRVKTYSSKNWLMHVDLVIKSLLFVVSLIVEKWQRLVISFFDCISYWIVTIRLSLTFFRFLRRQLPINEPTSCSRPPLFRFTCIVDVGWRAKIELFWKTFFSIENRKSSPIWSSKKSKCPDAFNHCLLTYDNNTHKHPHTYKTTTFSFLFISRSLTSYS